MARRLSKGFYQRPTQIVARALLGKVLVHGDTRARITECEAYLGSEDLASHARFGRTARSEVMFEAGGCVYVYLCYGVHYMFNVVTDVEGTAGAVLIRAVTLLDLDDGGTPESSRSRSDGPGKLTRALGLDMSHNRVDLTASDDLYLTSSAGSRRVLRENVQVGPRVGVDYAGDWARAPLRFVVR